MYFPVITITFILWITPIIHALSSIEPRSPDFTIDGVYEYLDSTNELGIMEKASQIESIIQSVNNSGIIFDVIASISNSDQDLDKIVNLTENILKNGLGALNSLSLNLNLNLSTILQAVNNSGIVFSVLDGLLLDDNNREEVTNIVGNILRYNPWITKLLYELGNGKKLTVDYIADLAQNFTSKDPLYKPSSYYTFAEYAPKGINKREDTQGSAQAFLNNLISTITGSSLVYNSVNQVLETLNQSGIIEPMAIQLLNDSNIYHILTYVSTNLYNDGALNNIDLNHYFTEIKKSGKLSTLLQKLVTNEKYGPPVGLILKQLEDTGVMKSMQRTLYGNV